MKQLRRLRLFGHIDPRGCCSHICQELDFPHKLPFPSALSASQCSLAPQYMEGTRQLLPILGATSNGGLVGRLCRSSHGPMLPVKADHDNCPTGEVGDVHSRRIRTASNPAGLGSEPARPGRFSAAARHAAQRSGREDEAQQVRPPWAKMIVSLARLCLLGRAPDFRSSCPLCLGQS